MKRTTSNWIFLLLALFVCDGAIGLAEGPLYPIEEKDKWGFIDATGRVVIPPSFDGNFETFSEGLAPVQVGRKWGYIDRSGQFVIEARFDSAGAFKDGVASVRIGEPVQGEGKYGYIDKSGKFVLELNDTYSYTGFSAGLMPVKVENKWGYVDRRGTIVIPARFEYAVGFSEGLGWAESSETNGFIDPSGRWVIRLGRSTEGYYGFHDGLAAVRDAATSKFGFINKRGEHVILPQFDDINSFAEGRAPVCVIEKDKTGWPVRKWGYIDSGGRFIVAPRFKHGAPFSEGLAAVTIEDKCGFIDREGKQVIAAQFDFAEGFKNGLARVQVGGYGKTGWRGYIDKKGRFVWRPSDHEERDRLRHAEQNRVPTVKLLTDPKDQSRGLLILHNRQVAAKGEQAGALNLTVTNCLEEEVFLNVSGFESIGCILDSADGGVFAGGGGFILSPDNVGLLKRLHASTYKNQQRFTCGCATARIKGKLMEGAVTMGRARGHATVIISGFYRNNGRAFSELIDLPIEILDQPNEQNATPSTAPSTKPAEVIRP